MGNSIPQYVPRCETFLGAPSEGHPCTEKGTFTGTVVNVGDLRRNSGECQGGSREHGVVDLPQSAKLRMKVHTCFWYTLKL